MQSTPTDAPLVSGRLRKNLWNLAGPMFVSALLQNLQTLIDLFWVGRLGSDAVAALAISGTILMLVFPLAMGLSTGTLAIVARRIGAGNRAEASSVTAQSLAVAVAAGILTGVVGWACTDLLTTLMGATSVVRDLAGEYLHVSFAGIVTVFVLVIGNSAIQAAGNARVPMQVMLLANVLNLFLDPLFIFGMWGLPAMGVRGAAIATVLAQAIAMGTIFARLKTGIEGLHVVRLNAPVQRQILGTLLRIGLPSSMQMLSRSLMAFVLMHIVARFGTAAVAAYGIGMRFHMLLLMPAFTLGNASAALVGQNLGAGKPERAARAAWLAVAIGFAIMASLGVILAFVATPLVRFFDDTQEVVAIGTSFMRIVSPFYAFPAFGIILSRCLQGAGDPVAPMIFTIVTLWGLQVPAAWYLPAVFDPPTCGIWWAMAGAMAMNAILTTIWFMMGRWKHRKV